MPTGEGGSECTPVRRQRGKEAQRAHPAWEDRDLWRQQHGVSPAAKATVSKSYRDLRLSAERAQTLPRDSTGGPGGGASDGRDCSSRLRKALVRPSINPLLSTWKQPQQQLGFGTSVYRQEAEKLGPMWLPVVNSSFSGLIKAEHKSALDRYRTEMANNGVIATAPRLSVPAVPPAFEPALTHRRMLTAPEHTLRPYTSHGPAPTLTERPVARRRSQSVAASHTRCWTPTSEFDAALHAPLRRRDLASRRPRPASSACASGWTPPHLRPPPPPPVPSAPSPPPAPLLEDWSQVDFRLIEEDAARHNAAPPQHSAAHPRRPASSSVGAANGAPDSAGGAAGPRRRQEQRIPGRRGATSTAGRTQTDPGGVAAVAGELSSGVGGHSLVRVGARLGELREATLPSAGVKDREDREAGEELAAGEAVKAEAEAEARRGGCAASCSSHAGGDAPPRESVAPAAKGAGGAAPAEGRAATPPAASAPEAADGPPAPACPQPAGAPGPRQAPPVPPEGPAAGRAATSGRRGKLKGTKTVNVLDSGYVPYAMDSALVEAEGILREAPPPGAEAGAEVAGAAIAAEEDGVSSYYGTFGRIEERRAKWHTYNLKVARVNAREETSTRPRTAKARAASAKAMQTVQARHADAASSQALEASIRDVRAARPYFRLPGRERREYRATNSPPRRKAPPHWGLHDSVFVRRLTECDARDFLDTEGVLAKLHDADWARVVKKDRFRNFIARKDRALTDPTVLAEELMEVKEALWNNLTIIRSAFYFYCMIGASVGESAFSMLLNSWTSFTQECQIAEPSKSSPVSTSVLDTLFITVNFEDDKHSDESKENDDLALMRFEWYEILVRVAVLKYGQARETLDVSDAVQMLVERNMEPLLPPAAKEDPNVFRRERLYKFDVDKLFVAHLPFLEAVYNVYRVDNITNFFWMQHFVKLLEACQLIGSHTGISKFEAKLMFTRSKMAVVDELKRRQRTVSAQFVDFLEVLGRIADYIALPTRKDLDDWLEEAKLEPGPNPYWTYNRTLSSGVALPIRRASCAISPKTRPLHEKLEALLDLMLGALCQLWDEPGERELTAKMKKVIHKLTVSRRKPND
eukprot:jgi/Tetstr1/423377/TSEL_014064.t1